MVSSYYRNLIKQVLYNSYGDTWEEAVEEWEIIDWEEDKQCNSFCVCGKENIRYLYTIQNIYTKRILYPIGSSCIKKFERDDLDQTTIIIEQMFKLLNAIKNRERIELNSKYFTKKLIKYLYDEGASDSQSNGFDGYNDYQFMLDMFRKRDKNSISQRQKSKINGIIGFSIKPYLIKKLEEKNSRSIV